MRKVITYQICDVCNYREVSDHLPNGWQTYRYSRDWKDGIHSGTHEKSFIACPECEDSRPLFKKILDLIKDSKNE